MLGRGEGAAIASAPSEAPTVDREVSSSRASRARRRRRPPGSTACSSRRSSCPCRAASRRSSRPGRLGRRRSSRLRGGRVLASRPDASAQSTSREALLVRSGCPRASPKGSPGSTRRGSSSASPYEHVVRGPGRCRLDAARRVRRPRARSRRLAGGPSRRAGGDWRSGGRSPNARAVAGPSRAREAERARAAHDPGRQAGDVRPDRRRRRPRAQQPAHVDRRLLRLSHPQGRSSRGPRRRGRRAPASHQRVREPHAPLHARPRELRAALGRGAGAGRAPRRHRSGDRVLRARAVGVGGARRARLRARRARRSAR